MIMMGSLIQTFLDHLSVERGVSAHTISAYRRDLHRYQGFLAALGVSDPAAVSPTMINDFIDAAA